MDTSAPVLQVYFTLVKMCCPAVNILSRSKTSLMDPRFGPAWIAFGHTFALESEHDHAVTAYSTCARMFTGYVPEAVHSKFSDVSFQFTSPVDVRWDGAHYAFKLCPSG